MDGDGYGDVLRVEAVRKRYSPRGRWVLDGVDLQAGPGTVTVVAGGNGSGKSTLLRVAAGLSRATSGRVTGRPARVGYVPEQLPARLRMTATRYLAHLGRLRGLTAAETARRSRELLDQLALCPGPDVPIGSLSKGNRQKVALAQAWLAPVGLLLLDEPYSGLDSAAYGELDSLLRQACDHRTTVLVTAHDPHAVAPAHAAHLMVAGRLRPVTAGGSVPLLHLVLRAVEDTASVSDLTGPGVDLLEHTPPRCRLAVRAGRAGGSGADALLARALSHGWSLVEAVPAGPSEGGVPSGGAAASDGGVR